jgi:hypothetical protein
VHGLRSTRNALATWRAHPGRVLRGWLLVSLGAACLLLLAVALIAAVTPTPTTVILFPRPPLVPGGPPDVLRILGHNMLVLALHAMACVAGFIAGSSLPLQASQHSGFTRTVHEKGRPIAIAFVVAATAFSLSWQAYAIGTSTARVAYALHTSPTALLACLLPHALPELVALFLPLAAWILASRRGEWDRLLAATFVTVGIAVPVLVATATWETYVAPHIVAAVVGPV